MRVTHNNLTIATSAPRFGLVLAAWTCVAVVLPVYRILPEPARIAWFCATFGLMVLWLVLGRVARPLYPVIWILAGYGAVVATVTATGRASVPDNLFTGSQLAILLGVGPFVLRWLVLNIPDFTRTVCIAFLIGQTCSSAAGIAQIMGTSVFGFATVQGRAPGLSAHPNVLGLLSCLALLVCVQALVHERQPRILIGAAGASAINIGGLLSTGSLSSLMAGAAGLLVTAICLRDQIKHLSRIIVGTAIVSWVVLTYTDFADNMRTPADRYLQVTGQTDAESTWEIRQRTYQFAWDAIREDPLFGVGLPVKFGATFDGITLTHNFLLRSWFQGGIALALLGSLIVLAVLIVAMKALRHKDNGLAAGVLVTVMAFALTSAFFEQPNYWLPALLAWAALRPWSKPESAPELVTGNNGAAPPGLIIAGTSTPSP
uniref:O-antigen polymerase n=2 Tax=unclassified Mycobacterium TaxID=2642494 RepID=A0A5Q5BFT6_MYCSS